jgi:hypothetical protein
MKAGCHAVNVVGQSLWERLTSLPKHTAQQLTGNRILRIGIPVMSVGLVRVLKIRLC